MICHQRQTGTPNSRRSEKMTTLQSLSQNPNPPAKIYTKWISLSITPMALVQVSVCTQCWVPCAHADTPMAAVSCPFPAELCCSQIQVTDTNGLWGVPNQAALLPAHLAHQSSTGITIQNGRKSKWSKQQHLPFATSPHCKAVTQSKEDAIFNSTLGESRFTTLLFPSR